MKQRFVSPMVLTLSALVATAALLSGCGQAAATIAQDVLYPVAQVNKAYPTPANPPAGYGQVSFDYTAQDNSAVHVMAWTYEVPKGSNLTIVYAHGNGENLQALSASNFLQVMTELEANYIIIDYPSYGLSTGEDNQYNLVTGLEKALAWAKQKWPSNKVIIWGRSLGAGVATLAAAASQGKYDKLALTSAWTSFDDVALSVEPLIAKQLPQSWLTLNNYPSLSVAPQIKTPVLQEHGTADTTIPYKFGQELNAGFTNAASNTFVPVPGRNHNDMFEDQLTWQSLYNFIHGN